MITTQENELHYTKDVSEDEYAETKMYELGILMELGSEEEFLELKKKEKELICQMLEHKASLPGFLDYVLYAKPLDHIESSVSIDMSIADDTLYFDGMTTAQYESILEYRVIEEVEGNCNDFYFPFTLPGLYDALKKLNELYTKLSFE
ncbi:hypothetical protein [Bacillus thuringiensis]|uniref:hypothetical protein n=1 Tax=Bacillus thuringiensis TaxID=1428 RepID=UPI0021D69142|nr:hypothetical protein [Bacillus thuringiensis]MCU7667456.1 hypothetical protein [Bacillus thuringiensis]